MPSLQNFPDNGTIRYDVTTPGVLGSVLINDYSVLGIPAYFRAMNYIANNMTSFPRFVARDGVKTPHSLAPLLKRRPNGYQSPTMFWRTLFFHRGHYGNGYAEIERGKTYQPVAFHNRMPGQVIPFRYVMDDGSILQAYAIVEPRKMRIVLGADMIHFSALSYDGMSGLNPIWLMYEGFERARTVDRFMTRFLTKGTVIRGSIEIPAGVSPEKQAEVVNLIQTKFGGGANGERDVIVLSEGAKLSNATLSPQDSQLIEQAGYTTKQIAQITGVPPVFLFDQSESKYNNTAEQAGQMVVQDLFRPLTEQDEDELTMKLLTPEEQDDDLEVKFDLSALLRGDTKTSTDVAIAKKTAGITTANQALQELGLPESTDPEANKLKTSGDTSAKPPATTTPPETKP